MIEEEVEQYHPWSYAVRHRETQRAGAKLTEALKYGPGSDLPKEIRQALAKIK